jgi:hypothetical protein
MESESPSSAEPCRLCGTGVPSGVERCPSCGLHRATRLSRATLWRLAAGLAAVYLATALLLILSR